MARGVKAEALNWTVSALQHAVMRCSARAGCACCGLQMRNWLLIMSSFADVCNCLPQLMKNTQTHEGVKRKANIGHRKLCVEDRILLYLLRKWRNVPFEGLRIFFGISFGSAVEHFTETAEAYHDHVAGRLLYSRSGDEIDAMAPEDFKRDLPGHG